MGAVLTLALVIETCPARISAFSRERDSSGKRAASTRSSRGDPSSPATVTSNLSPLFEDEPCSKEEPCFKKRLIQEEPRFKKSLCMTETAIPEPTPEQAVLFARVRRMMLIAGLTTALAIAAVLIAIGYRLFRSEGSLVTTDTTATLPRGARIVSTGVAGDRLVVTLDIGGITEIRTFDAKTLRPAGKLRFVNEP